MCQFGKNRLSPGVLFSYGLHTGGHGKGFMTMNNDDDRYLGMSFMTSKSGTFGVIVEVAAHGNPTFRRVRMITPAMESKWTSATIMDLHAALVEPVAQP